jgi:ParB-like chromosome segregation protein Spo0J
LKPGRRNARTHSKKQIRQIAASIERFGFTSPVLVDDGGRILAGHGRVAAAKLLGLASIPTIPLSQLSESERRAYALADNRIAQNAGWDRELLALELGELIELDFDVELTGFSPLETGPRPARKHRARAAEAEWLEPVTRQGDCWKLGEFRLLCVTTERLGEGARVLPVGAADIVATDPRCCDLVLRGFAALTGAPAVHAATGRSFDVLACERLGRGGGA